MMLDAGCPFLGGDGAVDSGFAGGAAGILPVVGPPPRERISGRPGERGLLCFACGSGICGTTAGGGRLMGRVASFSLFGVGGAGGTPGFFGSGGRSGRGP